MKRAVRELRIVGGSLRGRRWTFPDSEGLRPTPDRVRETVFNWLAPHIAGMRVLDLFAGSGALGIEALSRGAASAVLVDADRLVADGLRSLVKRFDLPQVRVECTDAASLLRKTDAGSFDLVFVDPPFAKELLAPTLALLAQRGILAPGGFCYVEAPAAAALPPAPAGWRPHRSGKAGEVGYHLLHATPSDLPRNL